MQRVHELNAAREQANRDALTGVKSKHFYVETERDINLQISEGTVGDFSITVCDMNGLKQINDTAGHAAGDELIRKAAMEICNVFEHSPVFRYGGEEFAALLRGRDWKRRRELMEQITSVNRENKRTGGVVVACGLADYQPGEDACMADVFARADAASTSRPSRASRKRC